VTFRAILSEPAITIASAPCHPSHPQAFPLAVSLGGRFPPPPPGARCSPLELGQGWSILPPRHLHPEPGSLAAGKPALLFAMHSTCFLSGCKEPEQTFLAALRHVRGHISCFFLLIKNSSDGGVEEKADGGSRKGKYACDKQVNGNLCRDS